MHARRWKRRLQSRKTNGLRSDAQWMQQYAHLARLRGGIALPLALLPQRTGTTTAAAGRVHDAQTPIGFPAPLMGTKLLACWTTERPIGLERKVLPREATRFPRRVAVAGGPYPDAGAGEAAACSVTGGMAGANSVVRMDVGSN